jgi:long-chain acyl-CoA synthetase
VALDLDLLEGRFAGRTAASFPDEALTYAGLIDRARVRAGELRARGIERGQRTALVCRQNADTIVSIVALLELGSAFLPIGNEAPAPDRSRMAAAFRSTWLVEDGKPTRTEPGRAARVALGLDGDPEVLALASSGSTGRPKLALLSASQLRSRTRQKCRSHDIRPDDRNLGVFPLEHTAGLQLLLASLSRGACLVFPPSAHPRSVVRTCAAEGVTLLHGSAMLFDFMVHSRRADWPGLDDVRFARSTAAGLSLETHRAFTEAFGIPLWQTYGASEAGGICVNRDGASHDGVLALGEAGLGVEVRICDERGQELPDGEVGEIVAASPGVAMGYEDDPGTSSRIHQGRFFSGDLGERRDALFYFRGRSKLMINVAGRKVDPIEVERALMRHSSVADAAVVADAAPGHEVVKAIVVTRAPVEPEELMDFCGHALAPYKVPRRIEFRSALPRNAIGKLSRERL